VKPETEFFEFVESQFLPESSSGWKRLRDAGVASVLFHALLVLVLFLVTGTASWFASDGEDFDPFGVRVRFYAPGGEGAGGGGGGGGSGGKKPTAYIRARVVEEPPAPEVEVEEPRRAAIAPRKPRPLSYDDLNVPDLPTETALLFEGVFSPDAVEFPGLSLTDGRDYGGIDRERSSGSGGGIGGGTGTGVGTGEGWGVGPGRGGGFGGGDYAPGAWDIEPVLIFQPKEPTYPPIAREKMIQGEVILEVLVLRDGSTSVVGVLKSLPYCVDAAKENAKLWRWKPAMKDGKPVDAIGIITVKFDLFAQGNARS
jgi:protein TonB